MDKVDREVYRRHLQEAGRLLNDARFQPLTLEQIRAMMDLAFEHVMSAARALDRNRK